MKKKPIIIIIISVIIIMMFSAKPLLNLISKSFWNFVNVQLDKEEQERQQKIQDGELVRGKDTILMWGNMYQIGRYSDGDYLSIKTENEVNSGVLGKVIKHKAVANKLYVILENGCAVIDENNLCKIFISISGEEIATDLQGNEENHSQCVVSQYVEYLSNINEFSEEEQKVLSKLYK
mgnify:CR=1 FL=1